MKHFFIKAFLASLFFILTSANFALAQESQESFQDWKNRMLKNHPHEEWIVGFGQCEAREKHASDKAQDMATLSAARNISVKTRQYTESEGYAKRVLTSNSDDEYIHRIDASFCSVSSEVDMVNIRYETHRYDGSVYAFAYISRKDYVDWLQREIKRLLGEVNKGVDNAKSYYENCEDSQAEKTKKELKEKQIPEIREYEALLIRTSSNEYKTKDLSDKIVAAGTRLDKAKSEALKTRKSRIDGCAAVASIFVPGAGQWYKGNKFKDNGLIGDGVGFFLGEVALAGGGLTSYFLSKKQLALMRDPNVSYVDFQKAKKNYKVCRITTIVAYSAAAALHIGNIFHAGFKAPEEGYGCVQLYPTVISTDTEVVGGVGLTYNF